MTKSIYDQPSYEIGRGTGIVYSGRTMDQNARVRPALPGSVIVIHGVNDLGVSYDQVEAGLCAGLTTRLALPARPASYQPASYRTFAPADRDKLLDDPDAVFFKRQADADTYSPVIPFYWGFREVKGRYKPGNLFAHGQAVDRYGNRLDKDYSKGGGPFAKPPARCPTCGGVASGAGLTAWSTSSPATRCAR